MAAFSTSKRSNIRHYDMYLGISLDTVWYRIRPSAKDSGAIHNRCRSVFIDSCGGSLRSSAAGSTLP